MSQTRVLVADDDALMVEALCIFVESAPDLTVVGNARTGRQAVERVAQLRPDIVLMDMQMPELDGAAATAEICKRHPDVAVLAVSSFATDRYVVQALRNGASGYLVKDTKPDELVRAIRAVLQGESVLSPEVIRHVVAAVNADSSERTAPATVAQHISEREAEVLKLLARGRSNREIAGELYLTEATVKSHLARIMAKLGVRDRVQAVIRAYEWGLANPSLES